MIRFAIWAAVSTAEQVEGASLESQVLKSRERALSEGWVDTGLVYIADGYSRTGYINLSDAERDIEPLAKCMTDMRLGKYDLLVMWSYDRLGDLMVMIATDFRNHRKQLFALSQPTSITESYDPYMDDSGFVMQAFAPIWDKMRKADLRRKYTVGMPRRIDDGLHATKVPFGYRKVAKNEPGQIVPAEVELIHKMHQWLMAGESLMVIAKRCAKTGILSPQGNKHWHESTVARILGNPYYAGITNFRQHQGFGKHDPIFTVKEHHAILYELETRRQRNIRSAARYPLSGLLYCGVCGSKLVRGNRITKHKDKKVVAREVTLHEKLEPFHVTVGYDSIFPHLCSEIQKAFIDLPNVEVVVTDYSTEIKELERRRKNVQQSAELGVYTPYEAAKRIKKLEEDISSLNNRKGKEEAMVGVRTEFTNSMSKHFPYLAEWIQDENPALVNRLLRSVINRVMVYPDQRVVVEWR